VRVAARDQRRRQVVVEAIRALELLGDALLESGIGVQACDLVLVLVRQQLK